MTSSLRLLTDTPSMWVSTVAGFQPKISESGRMLASFLASDMDGLPRTSETAGSPLKLKLSQDASLKP